MSLRVLPGAPRQSGSCGGFRVVSSQHLSLTPGDPPRPLGGPGCRGHRELEGHGDAVHRRVLPLEGQSSGSGETPGTLGMGSGPLAPVTLLEPVDCALSVFSSSGW